MPHSCLFPPFRESHWHPSDHSAHAHLASPCRGSLWCPLHSPLLVQSPGPSPCSSRDATEIGHTVQESQLFQGQQMAVERSHGPGTSTCGHDAHDGDLDSTNTQAGFTRTRIELPPASRERPDESELELAPRPSPGSDSSQTWTEIQREREPQSLPMPHYLPPPQHAYSPFSADWCI